VGSASHAAQHDWSASNRAGIWLVCVNVLPDAWEAQPPSGANAQMILNRFDVEHPL